MASFNLNQAYLKQVLEKPIQREITRVVKEKLAVPIMLANDQILRKFEGHPISAEISAGPEAANTSWALGGYGNLFTFLGFNDGDDPVTTAAMAIIKNAIKIESISTTRGSYAVTVTLRLPTRDDFRKIPELNLPWADKNWLLAIEDGISGLGQYMYKDDGFDTSRSENGIQIRGDIPAQTLPSGEVRLAQYVAHDYLMEIIANITKKLISNIRGSFRV